MVHTPFITLSITKCIPSSSFLPSFLSAARSIPQSPSSNNLYKKSRIHFYNQFGLYHCSFTVIAVFADCPDADIIATDPMVIYTMPIATDYYTDKPLTVSCSPMPGTEFTKDITVVNCMASDADGHVAPQMCSFNVQICKKIS